MKNPERKKIVIGAGKTKAWASESYESSSSLLPELIGREKEMRLVTAAWLRGPHNLPFSPLLVGKPGVGKNRLVYELARQSGRKLYIMQGHEDVTAEDLACAVRFSDNHNKGIDYVLSPLATAMLKGGICFIDEIGKIRPRALALLVSVLDERQYIDSTLLGERVYAAPNFRFIAATNTGEVSGLPEFIRSRMRPVVKIGFPLKSDLNAILEHQFPIKQPQLEQLLNTFWTLWQDGSDAAGKFPTPREAIHLFALASNLSELESRNTKDKKGLCLEPVHLKTAFHELHAEGVR